MQSLAVTGSDITLGLPRVEELLEARIPSSPAVLSDVSGEVLKIEKNESGEKKIVILLNKEIREENNAEIEIKAKKRGVVKAKQDTKEFIIPFNRVIEVKTGDSVKCGGALTDGAYDIKKFYSLTGKEEAQNYIIKEVSKVYYLQGAAVNLKHIEVVARQMFSRIKIKDPGETNLITGKIVDALEFIAENEKAAKNNLKQAEGGNVLLGLTKVALSTSSVLSAASFQDTTRVLVDAGIRAKKDVLRGLKENVIIGRLIPAGTNFRKDFDKKDD